MFSLEAHPCGCITRQQKLTPVPQIWKSHLKSALGLFTWSTYHYPTFWSRMSPAGFQHSSADLTWHRSTGAPKPFWEKPLSSIGKSMELLQTIQKPAQTVASRKDQRDWSSYCDHFRHGRWKKWAFSVVCRYKLIKRSINIDSLATLDTDTSDFPTKELQ
jgi:hypothetical protein